MYILQTHSLWCRHVSCIHYVCLQVPVRIHVKTRVYMYANMNVHILVNTSTCLHTRLQARVHVPQHAYPNTMHGTLGEPLLLQSNTLAPSWHTWRAVAASVKHTGSIMAVLPAHHGHLTSQNCFSQPFVSSCCEFDVRASLSRVLC